ncbi:hypothetical protein R1sor_025676 [Riccia sorocarpa]|uniref:Uncharacterized protein n=1 Tax=Riccia sorocarpa TaxID=122646 RepID=A0ABD3G9S6_9MARC
MMRWLYVSTVISVLAAMIAILKSRSTPTKLTISADIDFDFSYLVLQWPGSFCNLERPCCDPKNGRPAANFTIHGLWPQLKRGKFPEYCDPTEFHLTEIADLVPELNQYWPSLSCPTSDSTGFWKHEWERHGSCSSLNQHDYFKKTLALVKSVDLLKALQGAGMEPNIENTYDVLDVQHTLRHSIGKTPGIQCNKRQTQLFQVYICVDVYAENFIECPNYPDGRCLPKIHWPIFPQGNL